MNRTVLLVSQLCPNGGSQGYLRGPAASHTSADVRKRLEPVTRIELACPAWEAGALPLSYTGAARGIGDQTPAMSARGSLTQTRDRPGTHPAPDR